MNAFQLRDSVIADYRNYVQGFVKIKDKYINDVVQSSLQSGLLWPAPIIQLNPAYVQGDSFDELVANGVLHPECERIFIDEKSKKPLKFYKHQTEAFKRAHAGQNYILTTGTGSGKSLTYIVPIVDAVLRNGSGRGVQAIVVYPMNALANSQIGELDKFLNQTDAFGNPITPPVTYRRYTGQESLEEKEAIRNNPPDIILTNYMMLELMLTRKDEIPIVETLHSLRYLVLDELHSYRGRQGADVAMLARRLIEASGSHNVQCVGTSATLVAGDSQQDGAREVAKLATTIFGRPFLPENVINEYLTRHTPELDFTTPELRAALARETEAIAQGVDDDEGANDILCNAIGAENVENALLQSTLAAWLESTFGVKRDELTGELKRQEPRPIEGEGGAAEILAQLTELDKDDRNVAVRKCATAIKLVLLCGSQVKNEFGKTFFPFKLHQFVGRGENAYATAELGPNRRVYMQKQVYAPDSDRTKKIYPLVFCAHCGQEYYCVTKVDEQLDAAEHYDAREPFSPQATDPADKDNVGFLYLPDSQKLTKDEIENNLWDNIPEEWKDGDDGVKKERAQDMPKETRINLLGEKVPAAEPDGIDAYFIRSPFRFCPECGAAYAPQSAKTTSTDSGRVTSLNVGGRSTATDILALATEERLYKDFPDPDKPKVEDDSYQAALQQQRSMRKFLSFTDNRQDASLQAGHFNDFIEVASLRGALYKAVASAQGQALTYYEIGQKVFDALDLDMKEYAIAMQPIIMINEDGEEVVKEPKPVKGPMRTIITNAMIKSIRYRVMRDLRRGWRFLVPNLEQTGLLKIEYNGLNELVNDKDEWQEAPIALQSTNQETRIKILNEFLNTLRRELAVGGEELDRDKQQDMVRRVCDNITPNWGFDNPNDLTQLYHAKIAYNGAKPQNGADPNGIYISYRGLFGQYVINKLFPNKDKKVDSSEQQEIIAVLFSICADYRILEPVVGYGKTIGYRISPEMLLWRLGDGKVDHSEPTRQIGKSSAGDHINEFFKTFYSADAIKTSRLFACEHTAQVDQTTRQEREKKFRNGDIPILFCSPTMELGVDISTLNVVHMRNIPPTPANYAQRSGRAGRSGSSALVLVYGSSYSQHDRYYFKRPHLVVSGQVKAPQIDLANEDLILSHLRAIWLTVAAEKKGFSLGASLNALVETPENLDDSRECDVKPEVLETLRDADVKKDAFERVKRVLATVVEKGSPDFEWLTDDWIVEKLKQLERDFTDACKRWISLYMTAFKQQKKHNERANNHRLTAKEQDESKKIRAQAEREMRLLRNESTGRGQSVEMNEFYSYRYFASEGFLPGYNFTRLPVVAYLPGNSRRRFRDDKDGYLQRPRFLAISEFGPKAIVYHEGARYIVESVTLPLEERKSGENALATGEARICVKCGYYHDSTNVGLDVCENCGTPLDEPLKNLLELQKVTARRRDRINCNEEERMRFGYDMETTYRFATRGETRSVITVEINKEDGERWGVMKYGPGATIYRINKGFRKSKKESEKKKKNEGYVIDVDTGRWLADKEDAHYDPRDDEYNNKKAQTQRVCPYVREVKNCIILRPESHLGYTREQMASLQAALQRAIERVFSVEDRELAAFALPDETNRAEILFYEAVEGSAGVLRKLRDPEKFREVIDEALDVCHFSKEGEDLEHAPNVKEKCEAACYDCLLSYGNQHEHDLLDRQLAKEILMQLRGATLRVSPTARTRAEQFNALTNRAESELERKWLTFLEQNELNLPDEAQVELLDGRTRPDFYYEEHKAAVYIDGPHHDQQGQAQFDQERRDELEERGYQVVVFRYDCDWNEIANEYADVFKGN